MAEAGHLIGPYRLQKRLGRGAMGEVWRARDERLDRLVALKLLPTGHLSTAEKRGQMLREAKAAAGVPHPNVVTLYDIYSEGDRDYLVMELVEGETLSFTVREAGPLSPPEAISVISSVMGALAAAHERGILHRDVKSANIMRTADGTVKVLDFGLAKLRESDLEVSSSVAPLALDQSIELDATLAPTVRERENSLEQSGLSDTALPTQENFPSSPMDTIAGDLIGTPLYMSPEQVLGDRPDATSEVFTVGIVAYELLVGRPPYSSKTLNDLFAEIDAHKFPPLPQTVPSALAEWLKKATAKERDERFATMSEALERLEIVQRKLYGGHKAALKWFVPLLLLAAIATGLLVYWVSQPAVEVVRPGDKYVARALEEYDVFYQKKAISSLKAAIKNNPDHPRAYSYLVLFGDDEATKAKDEALRISNSGVSLSKKDRALLQAAIALAEKGPAAAREALNSTGANADRELAFWDAELAYRAAQYDAAAEGFEKLLANDAKTFRGRIFDHYSAVLLYLGKAKRAVEIGKLYADAFPGEADAIGVYATTLSAHGEHDAAIEAAKEALSLNEGEDTLAGLGKVLAYAGKRPEAREQYRRSMNIARPGRRVLRRAALGLLYLVDGETEKATEVVIPCLPGGDDSQVRERAACLWVAGMTMPERIPALSTELDKLASAHSSLAPAYGNPKTLANLLRARSQFFGGGCVMKPIDTVISDRPELVRLLRSPPDFYAAYHVPFYRAWAECELEALSKRPE